jgi:hypothetical protein
MTKSGFAYTAVGKKQRFKCLGCGGYSTARQSEKIGTLYVAA